MDAPVLSGIIVYPVKGCRGISLTHAPIVTTGLLFDREWMIVDRNGTFVSQRTVPALALVETALGPNHLELRATGHFPLVLGLALPARSNVCEVTVHRDRVHAMEWSEISSAWVSNVLNGEYRLVRVEANRLVPSRERPDAHTAFADEFPLLMAGEASLGDLNRRIVERGGSTLPMDRFRPNLVVSGCTPYAEDTWRRFRIGEVEFVGERPCTRCSVTTVDQQTGERGVEPLATLVAYRRTPDGVIFGMNVTHRGPGERDARGTIMGSREIAVGTPIEILE